MEQISQIFSDKKETIKDYLFTKATSFINKKRLAKRSNIENSDLPNSENNDFNILNDFFNDLFTCNKSFNNLKLSPAEALSILPNDKNNKNELINEPILTTLDNISSKNDDKKIIFSKISENTNSSNDINDVKLEDILTPNINQLKTLPTTLENEKIIKIEKAEKTEKDCIIRISDDIQIHEKENNIIINNKIKEQKCEKEINTNVEINKKDNVYCFALDLLHENGTFQIKLNKNNDNAYLLKIRKVEIKDDYYEQIDYAKKYGRFSKLKYTAPNNKFWMQRYYYYRKFDDGIQMDRESWYSVTPEKIAKYTAKLIRGKTIIDGFCGSGGNVIQFSKYCSKVYAIDISYQKLSICKNNCKVYHCKDNIEFIHSDFLKMKNKIKADYIFLSPPWGGTEYKDSYVYSIKKFMYPDITEIIRVSLSVADNILFFLPRNLDLDELFNICSDIKNEMGENLGKSLYFDIQILESNKRIKSLLIIFGHNINEIFKKSDLLAFLSRNYKNIEEKYVNFLYSIIKENDCFKFFKEENIYRTTKFKEANLSYLVDYFKEKGYEK